MGSEITGMGSEINGPDGGGVVWSDKGFGGCNRVDPDSRHQVLILQAVGCYLRHSALSGRRKGSPPPFFLVSPDKHATAYLREMCDRCR